MIPILFFGRQILLKDCVSCTDDTEFPLSCPAPTAVRSVISYTFDLCKVEELSSPAHPSKMFAAAYLTIISENGGDPSKENPNVILDGKVCFA